MKEILNPILLRSFITRWDAKPATPLTGAILMDVANMIHGIAWTVGTFGNVHKLEKRVYDEFLMQTGGMLATARLEGKSGTEAALLLEEACREAGLLDKEPEKV